MNMSSALTSSLILQLKIPLQYLIINNTIKMIITIASIMFGIITKIKIISDCSSRFVFAVVESL